MTGTFIAATPPANGTSVRTASGPSQRQQIPERSQQHRERGPRNRDVPHLVRQRQDRQRAGRTRVLRHNRSLDSRAFSLRRRRTNRNRGRRRCSLLRDRRDRRRKRSRRSLRIRPSNPRRTIRQRGQRNRRRVRGRDRARRRFSLRQRPNLTATRMRESGPTIHEQNSRTGRIRGKINRPTIRKILRRIINPRGVRTIRGGRTTTKTSGNDNNAATV